jgi:hypothetical protein
VDPVKHGTRSTRRAQRTQVAAAMRLVDVVREAYRHASTCALIRATVDLRTARIRPR